MYLLSPHIIYIYIYIINVQIFVWSMKQYTYIKLNGTVLTHALKSDTRFSLTFSIYVIWFLQMSIAVWWCLLLVHQPVENLSLFRSWQYKWQHGSSSTGSGVKMGSRAHPMECGDCLMIGRRK